MISEQRYGMFLIIDIDISAYKDSLNIDMIGIDSLEGLKINVGRRIGTDIIIKGFEELNEFLREYNADNPDYQYSENYIDLDHANIPYQIKINWVYSKDEIELFQELSKELIELYNLTKTEVIINPNDRSRCETTSKIIRCHVQSESDMIHEIVHAFFRERNLRIREQFGKEYNQIVKAIVPDKYVEEIVARLKKCNENMQTLLKGIYESNAIELGDTYSSIGIDYDPNLEKYVDVELGEFNNIETVKKVFRFYQSLYNYYCICPIDYEFYKSIKNDIEPLKLYNKLAKYFGINEMIII